MAPEFQSSRLLSKSPQKNQTVVEKRKKIGKRWQAHLPSLDLTAQNPKSNIPNPKPKIQHQNQQSKIEIQNQKSKSKNDFTFWLKSFLLIAMAQIFGSCLDVADYVRRIVESF